jgi:hypothetical protein
VERACLHPTIRTPCRPLIICPLHCQQNLSAPSGFTRCLRLNHQPACASALCPHRPPLPPATPPQIGWSSTGQSDWDNLVQQANTLVQRIQMTVSRWAPQQVAGTQQTTEEGPPLRPISKLFPLQFRVPHPACVQPAGVHGPQLGLSLPSRRHAEGGGGHLPGDCGAQGAPSITLSCRSLAVLWRCWAHAR